MCVQLSAAYPLQTTTGVAVLEQSDYFPELLYHFIFPPAISTRRNHLASVHNESLLFSHDILQRFAFL